jgi:hypothetical protein
VVAIRILLTSTPASGFHIAQMVLAAEPDEACNLTISYLTVNFEIVGEKKLCSQTYC